MLRSWLLRERKLAGPGRVLNGQFLEMQRGVYDGRGTTAEATSGGAGLVLWVPQMVGFVTGFPDV